MNDRQRNHKVAKQNNRPRNGGTKLRPAIFLDRDGTVTDEVGYINHISRAKIYPYAPEAVRMLKSTGLPVIIVTNQSGVGRGYFTEETVSQVHRMVQDTLQAAGTSIDEFYFCPHHPSAAIESYRLECRCRKPGTGMAEQAADRFGIDLGASYVVGDTYRDMQMGFNIGARTVLLMTGYGRGEYEHRSKGWPRMPDLIAEDLLGAAKLILKELNASSGAGVAAQSVRS
ncbi:MAG: HAD family hydrolase [Acidobacteria bacterium]|nr:MAG: HAD family hydrolase [Acidobacteriota bacterium]